MKYKSSAFGGKASAEKAETIMREFCMSDYRIIQEQASVEAIAYNATTSGTISGNSYNGTTQITPVNRSYVYSQFQCEVGHSDGENIYGNGKIGAAEPQESKNWFFVVPSSRSQVGYDKPASEMIVHNGEDFGVGARFTPNSSRLRMQVKLLLPKPSKNFGCSTCTSGELTLSADKRTVSIDKTISAEKGTAAFFWSISPKDPRGDYEIQFALGDSPFDSYSFSVK